jgi:hypothetical protein
MKALEYIKGALKGLAHKAPLIAVGLSSLMAACCYFLLTPYLNGSLASKLLLYSLTCMSGFTAPVITSLLLRHQVSDLILSQSLKNLAKLGCNKPERIAFNVYSQGSKDVQIQKELLSKTLISRFSKAFKSPSLAEFKAFLLELLQQSKKSDNELSFIEELFLNELLAITKVSRIKSLETPFLVTFNLLLGPTVMTATVKVTLVEFNTYKPLIRSLIAKLKQLKKEENIEQKLGKTGYNPRLFFSMPGALSSMHQLMDSQERAPILAKNTVYEEESESLILR